MKQLIISTLSLLLIISLWAIFLYISISDLEKCRKSLEDEILPLINEERFEEASVKLEETSKDLKSYVKKAMHFDESEKLFQIRSTLTRAIYYVKAEDVSNGSGEVAALLDQIDYMLTSQIPSFNNIL